MGVACGAPACRTSNRATAFAKVHFDLSWNTVHTVCGVRMSMFLSLARTTATSHQSLLPHRPGSASSVPASRAQSSKGVHTEVCVTPGANDPSSRSIHISASTVQNFAVGAPLRHVAHRPCPRYWCLSPSFVLGLEVLVLTNSTDAQEPSYRACTIRLR